MGFEFPNNAAGDVFRRLCAGGDALTKARTIEFFTIFPLRKQALGFAEIIDELDRTVSISFYDQRALWQCTVSRCMVPADDAVANLEGELEAKAARLGGKPDGWICAVPPNQK